MREMLRLKPGLEDMSKISRLAGVLPFLVFGPITGLLALGMLRNLKHRRLFMSGVYALGIVEVVIGLPMMFAKELSLLAVPHL
jgi:hypothetical protein